MCNLSIIVPVYNVEKYVEKCIKSIINQSYRNYELILVDDGSRDKSGEICDYYSKKDERIRVIHKKNGGLSSARNAGIDVAKGKYIGFVDSDDWIDSNMYKILIELAEKHKADIVQCKFLKALEDNAEIKKKNSYNVVSCSNIESLFNLYNDNVSHTIVSWSKIYKSELYDDIRFPEGRIHEDKFTTYKLLYKCRNVIFTDQELYYYRQNDASIMNSKYNIHRLDSLLASRECISFYKKINNKKLYKKAMAKYEGELRWAYFNCRYFLENYDVLKDIKRKYNSLFIESLFNNEIKYKEKVKGVIFFISPNIYSEIIHASVDKKLRRSS